MNSTERQNPINTCATNLLRIAWAAVPKGCTLAWFVVRWSWLEWWELQKQRLWENKMMLERCWEMEVRR